VFTCNICEESFEGDRTTCSECFKEIAAIVSANLFTIEEPDFKDKPVSRYRKLRTSIESCNSKAAYKTPEEAVRMRKRLGKQKPEIKSQRIYKCDSCKFWHLTSAKNKNQ